MRNDLVLPGLAVAGGAACFGLRLAQRLTAFDPETLLFAHGSPFTFGLLALVGVLTLAFLFLTRAAKAPAEPASAFRCPSTGYMTLMAASAMLMLGGGVLGLLEGMSELALWRADPERYLLTYPLALLLCALLCFAAGPATLMLGRSNYRGPVPPVSSLLAVFPPMAALVWVFATHMAHGTDPVLMDYGVSLAAAILLMLAHYETAALFHDRPHPRRALFCAFLGTVLGLTSLADRPGSFCAALTVAFSLSALANGYALTRSAIGPPWPKRLLEDRMPLGAEDEGTDETTDETDHGGDHHG